MKPERVKLYPVVKYDVESQWTSTWLEKYVIEGHEYLVFHNKIANPPFVIHSESCPCHERK